LPRGGDDDATERAKRLRRRGLRHGMLIRHLYRGHPVPDAPTSPGENARVWPSPIPHVPDGQILNVGERRRRLFNEDWDILRSENVRRVMQISLADLGDATELRELGTALFLDRPFGIGKRPSEPDRTLMFSYVAFSRNVARVRLRQLA